MKAVVLLAIIAVANAVCPNGFHSINGSCYKFHQSMKTWNDARRVCEAEGSHMAAVVTATQYNALLNHIASNYAGQYWLAGCYVGNAWIWTSTGNSVKKSWFGRSPTRAHNYCSYFCSLTWKYWSSSVSARKRFICEKNLSQGVARPSLA